MIRAKQLGNLLASIASPNIRILLTTHDGCIIASSKSAIGEDTTGALVASIYTEYFAFDNTLEKIYVETEFAKIGAEMTLNHTIIIVVVGAKTVPFGLIQVKLAQLKGALVDLEKTLYNEKMCG
eukprot:GHVL01011054.1.p1 GENE.GHVL01011054.1~~GHVL01011054.1.p1  ORF type:complete len:134 (+),score=25.02 GHVL01011054.1:31-402(+)